MHIHAQTQVELDRKGVRVFSGSDQHVAITISITTSITISITISTLLREARADAGLIVRRISLMGLDVGLDVCLIVKTCPAGSPLAELQELYVVEGRPLDSLRRVLSLSRKLH